MALLPNATQPAYAAPAGALTINDSGNDSLPTPSSGVYDIQTDITVAPASIEAALSSGDVTLWATSISVSSDIEGPNANSLTLKATSDITLQPGVGITNQGGDVIFWADSDSSGSASAAGGTVVLLADSSVSSSNGSIVLAGGSDSNTDGIPDGYAYGAYSPGYPPVTFGGGSSGTTSVLLEQTTLNAGTGGIIVRGNGTGSAVNFQMGVWASESSISGGDISILGRASTQTNDSASDWGVMIRSTSVAGSGDISIQGWGGQADLYSTNQDGIRVMHDGASANSSIIASGSGSISLTGQGGQGSVGGGSSNGIEVWQSQTIQTASGSISMSGQSGRLGLAEGLNLYGAPVSTSGDINLTATAVDDGGTPQDTNGAIAFVGADAASGTLTLQGENSVIQKGLTSAETAANYVAAPIKATSLSLNGVAAYRLTYTSNAVGTVAAGSGSTKLASLSLYDASGGLTIGQVGALEGVTATGDVLIETGAGDITLARNIATDSTSGTAITLNAGDSTAAGTSTGGNIVVSGSPTLTTGTNGIVRLFSGSESGSTGLTTFVGGSSNVYYGVDENSALSPSLSAGTSYALYRAYEPCSPSEASVTSAGVAYKVLAFKNATLCDWSVPTGVTSVDVLAVGGGGAGGGLGGGGAGEFVEKLAFSVSGSLSVVAGAGGSSAVSSSSGNGSASSFGGITAAGGGGAGKDANGADGTGGASGGGGSRGSQTGGTSVNDSDADSFGNDGGNGWGRRNPTVGGGGGGAGASALDVVVANAVTVVNAFAPFYGESYTGTYPGGDAGVTAEGGAGKSASFISSATATALSVGEVSGATVYFAGGGGGGCGGTGSDSGCTNSQLSGGVGGGGDGTTSGSPGAGAASTGGGGGGYNSRSASGGAGGTGVVLIRYVIPDVGGSGSSSGSSGTASSESTVIAPLVPNAAPRQPRLAPFTLNISPVPRPVERLGLVFDPDAPSRATVGGVPVNLVKTPVGSKDLSIGAGAFQFGVSLAEADGGEVQTDTPSRSPELFVPRGQSAAVSGQGSYPGSFVQLFLPGNGDDSRELARIPVRSDGTFASDLSFQAGALELPVPIGRQVLQVVGYDERGNQTVVDMTVNIGQGVPAPEPNRQIGELPALTAGQSLATSGGIPETVSVTGVPETGNVVVEGSGWVISVNADRDNGVVENEDGSVLVRLNPSSVGTTFGNGFLPGTLATVWLFSEPTLMTTVTVDDNGEFSAEFLVDARLIAPGEHTLQVQGVGSDGYIKAANLGVLVEEPGELTTESASGLLWWIVGAFLLVLLFLLLLLARRRRSQEQ